MRHHHRHRLAAPLIAGLLTLAGLAGCDGERIEALEEGVATEADVRGAFGQPEHVWPEADGGRTLEFNRQPEGARNYMITIGPDGKMSALRQVLTPENIARIGVGMPAEEVRRRLGKPMRDTPMPRTGERMWDWRFLQPPNQPMVFTVVFGPALTVLRTSTMLDPASEAQRGH